MTIIYKCEICGKEFNSKLALGGHKGSHSRHKGMHLNAIDIYCTNCNKYMFRKSKKNASDVNFCCKKCERIYNGEIIVKKEIKKSTNKKQIIINRTPYKRMHNGDIIDITKKQYLEFKEKAQYCEICGKNTSHVLNGKKLKLLIDHCHKTKTFRGILCYHCNISLGWYEKYQDSIENYLNK